MCTVFIAWQPQSERPLLLLSNRDEFHQRPTDSAKWRDGLWLGGQDKQDGGAWLGVNRYGRFAVITNYRDPTSEKPDAPSRGGLVKSWLEGQPQPQFMQHLQASVDKYNGFNLLFGSVAGNPELYYFSNRASPAVVNALDVGVYGLSNALLDSPWPKVVAGKQAFEELLTRPECASSEWIALMRNQQQAAEDDLPVTGVPMVLEKLLSSLFIESPSYGTRATSLLQVKQQAEVCFEEVSYNSNGQPAGRVKERFELDL